MKKRGIGEFTARVACLIAFATVFAGTATALAKRVAVLYRGDIMPYLTIVDTLEQRPHDTIFSLDIVKAAKQSPGIDARLRAFHPDLVVAVGKGALRTASGIGSRVPVVFCMVLHPESVLKNTWNRLFVGVGMYVDPIRQVEAFKQSIPAIRRIGIIYTRKLSGDMADRFARAFFHSGLIAIKSPVLDARSALMALDDMKNRVDAYWLVPDRIVLTDAFMHRLMELSFRRSQPVAAFTRKAVHSGAGIAMVFNEQDVLRELNRLMDRFAHFSDALGVRVLPLSQGKLILNRTVLKKMRINIPTDIILKASEVY